MRRNRYSALIVVFVRDAVWYTLVIFFGMRQWSNVLPSVNRILV